MRCAWRELLAILPQWMRPQVNTLGKDDLQELRLRLGYPPEMVCLGKNIRLVQLVSNDDLNFVINAASKYSPWAAATSAKGYITAPGGHRIGMCGEAVVANHHMMGIRMPTSLCIRIARDFAGIARSLEGCNGSILIIGKPGSGKTTLLRDLIRLHSGKRKDSIAVVDERGEIFPTEGCFDSGPRTDVLRGCSKNEGIEILLRTMGPATIAVDEITSENDCKALLKAGWCGVNLFATAHAATKEDLYLRTVYQPLIKSRLFDHLVVLNEDKSCTQERMEI